MVSYIKILRIPNMFIVALLQSIMYYLILNPIFIDNNIVSVFSGVMFPVFILITVLIAASGNIINDILDVEIDKINKPDKWFVGNTISVKNAYLFYIILVLIGLILSIWIAYEINHGLYIFMYIFSIIFLYVYSKYLKKTVLIGNIIVSLFSAGVIGIILVFEYYNGIELFEINKESFDYISQIYFGFMLFSFFTSLVREIVKDMEDVEGDVLFKTGTLPLAFGIDNSKVIVFILYIMLAGLLVFWSFLNVNNNGNVDLLYIWGVIFPLLIYATVLLFRSKNKGDFGYLSKIIKILMFSGILLLLFY